MIAGHTAQAGAADLTAARFAARELASAWTAERCADYLAGDSGSRDAVAVLSHWEVAAVADRRRSPSRHR